MRFPVAVLMVAFGYAAVYWTLSRIYAFPPGSTTIRSGATQPATMSTLLGLTKGLDTSSPNMPPVHLGLSGATGTSNTGSTGTTAPNQGSGNLGGVGSGIGTVTGSGGTTI